MSIRVLIVDDHALVRRGLDQLLATAEDIEVVGSASTGSEAVLAVAELAPDIVLMDLSMPEMDGIEATRRIRGEHGDTRVIVLTSFAEQRKVVDALDAGAAGYLLKDCEPDEVLSAVRAAHAGGAPLHPKAARLFLDAQRRPDTAATLSAREMEVLRLVMEGLPNKNIARRLGIAESTVKAHLTAIYHAIGVTDRTQAAMWARDHLAD